MWNNFNIPQEKCNFLNLFHKKSVFLHIKHKHLKRHEEISLQQLCSVLDRNNIYYFAKDNSTQEIDFLVQTSTRILPIEVKATVNVKSKSLSTFINNDHADLGLKGVRCSLLPYTDQGWMENIPLYAAETYFQQYAEYV